MRHWTIPAAIDRHAQERPDALALIAGGERLTYRTLRALSEGFARQLLGLGLERGARVVMQAEQTADFVVAYMGVHRAGGIFTPVEKTMSVAGAREIAERAQASVVIARAEVDWPERLDTGEVLEMARCGAGPELPALPQERDPAELLFTTGTTGKSKGVLCSHRSVAAVAENLIDAMEYKPDTCVLVPGPVSHANGIRKLTTAFLNGSAVALLDGMTDLNAFYRALDAWPVTALCLPPAAVRILLMLSAKKLGGYASRIDFVESGTAPLPEVDKQKLCQLLPGARLYNSYGTSEAGSSCMYDYNRERGLIGCIGRPAVNARFVLVDEEGRPFDATRDNPGLIAYGGDMMMDGYWRAPELTAETVRDGLLYTSDIGYRDADDMIYVVGRKGDVINVGGRKVAPDEVEQAALRLPEVAECACVGKPDKMSGETVWLYVVMSAGSEFDANALRAALTPMLEDYKLPRRIEPIEALPRAANGKLQRNKLK